LIEISYIVNPAASTTIELPEVPPVGVPIISPNGKYFLLITQRGVLSTNCLEGTIWLFDFRAVADYASGKSRLRPMPTIIATLSATSNTPVISSVRWLEDSRRIAFLGKKNSPYQQLFIADVSAGSITAITDNDLYVSAYDISADTIAYSTLITKDVTVLPPPDLVDVTGRGIYSVLYPQTRSIEDMDQSALFTYPSALHIKRGAQEVPLSFTMAGKPLKIFIPTLSLSPDGRFLITVAPVGEIPASWRNYEPAVHDDPTLRLSPDNKYALAAENPWKASQYVIVDTQSGVASPLVDAPAGRGLVYVAPTRAFWFHDNRRAILTNTYLPFTNTATESDRSRRARAPALAVVDILTHDIQPISFVAQSPFGSAVWYRVKDVSWNEQDGELTLNYAGTGDSASVPPPERYRLVSERWVKTDSVPKSDPNRSSDGEIELLIRQTLTQPPELVGFLRGDGEELKIWDPNPQLGNLSLGRISIYRWHAKNGYAWSGLLALPPDYDSTHRYPLVIQTHGYEADRFFADGKYTTGSGGLALAAKGIIILQMDLPMLNLETPNDGPFEVDGFESAIAQLTMEGLVDASRVGVIGFSYTCSHVLYALTQRPDLFAAASITDGNNMSYVQYILSTDTGNGLQEISEKTNEGMPFGKGLVNWLKNAPNFNLDKVRAPVLISSFETGELIAQWETYSGLRKLRKPVDMVWLRKENAPHILVQPRQRYWSQEGAVDWFTYWLTDEEDRNPSKAEQYVRWRELRRELEEQRIAERHLK
jgi:dipeptidyl aminopeptidase/acylaminoacyl peptidase